MLDEQQISNVIAQRLAGKTIAELSEEHAISSNAIFLIVKDHPYLHLRTRLIGEYIYNFYRENGVPPTTREIAANAIEDVSLSTSIVDHHLKKLVKHGFIELNEEVKARKIKIPFAEIIIPDFDEVANKLLLNENNNESDL